MQKLLLLVLLIASFYSYAQNNKDVVRNWKMTHPEVKLISTATYENYSDDIKLEIAGIETKIVYGTELTMADIEAYENATDKLIPRSDAEIIFHWMQAHPGIKIIPHSHFTSLSSSDQLLYMNAGAMILLGEKPTVNDLVIYEHQQSN